MKRHLYSLLLMLIVTGISLLLRDELTVANITLIYVLVVVILAIRSGTRTALVGVVLSFLIINFFFIHPYDTLLVADSRDLLDLIIFLIVAVLAGQLAARTQEQARAADQRAREQEVLYRLTRTFNQLSTVAAVHAALVDFVRRDLAGTRAFVLPQSAEAGTSPPSHYILLQSDGQIFGTMCADFETTPGDETLRLLRVGAAQAAMALHRIALNERARTSQKYEEADRLKTAILRSVSHDLRTPITIIKTASGNLSRLDASLSAAERSELLESIEGQADLLDRLIGDLLDLSRLQAGALVLNIQPQSFEEIAGEVAARMYQRTKRERIRLDIPEDFPFIPCDDVLLLQALTNIVENGLRYEPDDSQIVISAARTDTDAQLSVVNHGKSIGPEERSQIMEPFYHAATGKAGLGLAIARGIVEAHHGQLWVQDTPGGGATFVIALPAEQKGEQ